MRRILRLIVMNVDVVVAVALSAFFGILDVFGTVSTTVMNGAIVLTLAALATSMLHNRLRDDGGSSNLQQVLTKWLGHEPIRILHGTEISNTLAEAREKADYWEFRGGTGWYIRAVTLPKMAERAERVRSRHELKLDIIDPTRLDVCRHYDEFYMGLFEQPQPPGGAAADRKRRMDGEGTRRQLYATILAACWYQRYSLLDIEVWLSSTMSMIRWEFTRDKLFVTHRSSAYPALLVDSTHPYFHVWSTEAKVSRDQARQLHLWQAKHALLSPEPTVKEVRDVFAKIDLEIPADYADSDIAKLIEMALRPVDPYANGG